MSKFAPKHGRQEDRGWYLRYAKAESFGAFAQTTLGPFGPGLNVVHGVNEAGKTTFANLIEGVMFGWEDGRSAQNTYKPQNAERSGALLFVRNGKDGEKQARLSRVKNADGVQGNRWLLDDIDRKTYKDIFALNSDQLMGMADAGQVTSRLLTASAGTAMPPAQAKEVLEGRIAEYTSKSSKYPHSITRLVAQRDELAQDIESALSQADALREEEAKLAHMDEERKKLLKGVNESNARIERLNQLLVSVDQMNDRDYYLRDCLADAQKQLDGGKDVESVLDVPARLMSIGPDQEASLREKVDAFEEEYSAASKAVEDARTDYESAFSEYDAKMTSRKGRKAALKLDDADAADKVNADDAGNSDDAAPRKRSFGLTIAFVVLALVFAASGLALGSVGGSSAMTSAAALYSGAVIFALIAVGIAIRNLVTHGGRGTKAVNALRDARWVMEKERSRYETAQARLEEKKQSIETQLEGLGLAKAEGDLHAAQALLDKASAARARREFEAQTRANTEARIAELNVALAENAKKLEDEMSACGIDPQEGTEAIKVAVEQAAQQREDLMDQIEELNVHAGQLKQRLDAARSDHDLDELRIRHQQVISRLEDSQRELAELLLARKMIDDAIDEWQGSYQPEVYREAGRLLSRMTGGRWCRVVIDDEGKLWVADALGGLFDPYLLSTATCQQLYLSVRIALLNTASLVGANVPVICDDILVNFDEKRRRTAAHALARLARTRQVIIFTCHKDIVSTLRWADFGCNVIEL